MKKEKRDLEATKKALLDAAEKLMMNCSEPSEVTSRAITNEAGVNLAMINYCFGSREAMLFEVFNRIKKTAAMHNPAIAKIITGDISPIEKLIEVHYESVKMMIQNYKYTKALTQYILLNRDIGAERGSVAFILEYYGGSKSEKECRFLAYELSSLHELLVLRYEDLKTACGIDLSDDATLRRVVTENITKLLG